MEDKIKAWILLIGLLATGVVGIFIPLVLIICWLAMVVAYCGAVSHELFHSEYVAKWLKYRRIIKNRKFYRLGGLKKSYNYIYKVEYDFKSYPEPYVFIYFSNDKYDRVCFQLKNDYSNKSTIRKSLKGNKAD